MENKPNSYKLSRVWFDFCFENPEKIRPNHTAMYFFCVEHCNRLGWKKKFGLPTTMAKDAIGIRSYNTYKNTLDDLVDWGFIEMIERSKNQYSSNIIALSNFNKALDKSLDKALVKHTSKHCSSIVESTHQSISSIIKQVNNEQLTLEQIKPLLFPCQEIISFLEEKPQQEIILNPEESTPKNSKEEKLKKKVAPKKKGPKEAISPHCKKFFMDYYLSQKEVEFYWTAADAVALNQLIAKIRAISPDKKDEAVKHLFEVFVQKIKAADPWVYDNLTVRLMNQKFNELVPKLKKVNASGQKIKIPDGYEAMMQKYINIINNGKS